MNYKLSPSDLTFLYGECKRCFYLKIHHQISQPSIPLPAIFSKIDSLLKYYYNGKHTKELHTDLPPGIVKSFDRYITSQNFHFEYHKDTCFISGKPDSIIEFDDGTYGVIDFKTSKPKDEYSVFYSRQLNAYAYALENPGPGSLELSPISMLDLSYFYPSKVSQESIDWLSFDSEIYLAEIKIDNQGFLAFVEEALTLLESSDYPDSSPNCYWCNYISKINEL